MLNTKNNNLCENVKKRCDMTKPLFVIKQCSQNCHRLINCTLLRFNKTKKLSCHRKIAVGKGFKVMSKTFNI